MPSSRDIVQILVCAPLHKDAAIISDVLRQQGYDPLLINSLEELDQRLQKHCDLLFCTQEGFTKGMRDLLEKTLAAQPAWSRLPFIIALDQHHASERLNGELMRMMPYAQITILHRPMRPLEFTTAISNAFIARTRQLEIRDHMDYQLELQRELNHRVKNTLSTFMAVYHMSMRQSTDLKTFAEKFNDRIAALAAVHDLLHTTKDGRRSFRDICEKVLAPYNSEDGDRITFRGPPLEMARQAAVSFGLILNELATNAIKYGALKADEGRVQLEWAVDQPGECDVTFGWRETGVPAPLSPSLHRGYGTRFIEASIAALGGTAHFNYLPEGLCVELTAIRKALSAN